MGPPALGDARYTVSSWFAGDGVPGVNVADLSLMFTNDSHVLPMPSITLRSSVTRLNLSSARAMVGSGSTVGYTTAGLAVSKVVVFVIARVKLRHAIAPFPKSELRYLSRGA